MEIDNTKLEEYKNKIKRKIERNKSKLEELEDNKNNLSVHGYWDLGYFVGRISELENLLDDINSLM